MPEKHVINHRCNHRLPNLDTNSPAFVKDAFDSLLSPLSVRLLSTDDQTQRFSDGFRVRISTFHQPDTSPCGVDHLRLFVMRIDARFASLSSEGHRGQPRRRLPFERSPQRPKAFILDNFRPIHRPASACRAGSRIHVGHRRCFHTSHPRPPSSARRTCRHR